MQWTRLFVLSCGIAIAANGCSSRAPTETSEPEATTGAETITTAEPAPAVEATSAAPVEPTPEAAPAEAAAQPQLPPLGAVITHKVKDYASWKPVFDADEQRRKDAGIVAHSVMKDVKKPNTISVWAAYADQGKLDAMFGSEDLKTKMKEGGVLGKPAVVNLKHVAMSAPSDKQPKFGAIVVHAVKDFDAWKTAFDAHDQARKDAGIVGYAVSQDPKDPNAVTVWLEAEEQAKLEEFLKSKDVKTSMKEAGVKGAPKTSVYEILEFKMYS